MIKNTAQKFLAPKTFDDFNICTEPARKYFSVFLGRGGAVLKIFWVAAAIFHRAGAERGGTGIPDVYPLQCMGFLIN